MLCLIRRIKKAPAVRHGGAENKEQHNVFLILWTFYVSAIWSFIFSFFPVPWDSMSFNEDNGLSHIIRLQGKLITNRMGYSTTS